MAICKAPGAGFRSPHSEILSYSVFRDRKARATSGPDEGKTAAAPPAQSCKGGGQLDIKCRGEACLARQPTMTER